MSGPLSRPVRQELRHLGRGRRVIEQCSRGVERRCSPGAWDGKLGLASGLSVGVDEPSPAEAESVQVLGNGAAVDRKPELVEFVGDPAGRPLVFMPPDLDALDDPGGRGARTLKRTRRAVLESGITVASLPVDPLRRACPRDPHLRGHVGDRTRLAALDQTTASLDAERGVGVTHASSA